MATFYQSVAAAFNKDAAGAHAVTELAKKAVRMAYSRPDAGIVMVQNMLDLMTKNYRDALPAFFKRAGIGITPATPQAPCIVNKVLDPSKQAKVFAWLEKPETVVVNPEDVMPKAKKPAADVKTSAEAQAKVQSWIDAKLKSLKEAGLDNLREAFQARLAAPKTVKEVVHEPGSFVTLDGRAFHLDSEESEAVLQFLLTRQISKAGLSVIPRVEQVEAELGLNQAAA